LGLLSLLLGIIELFLFLLQQTVHCIREVLQFILGFVAVVKYSRFVGERRRISDHGYDFCDELSEENSVLLRQKEIGTNSGRTAQLFLDFILRVDVVRSHRGTRFGVVVAEDFDVGSALPSSDVDVAVQVFDPLHRFSEGEVIVNHNTSVVSQDADEGEVAGDAAVLANHFGHFFELFTGFGSHERFGVVLGDDGNIVTSLLGEVLVVFIVKSVENVGVRITLSPIKKPKVLFNMN